MMRNLAGVPECDRYIVEELRRARIDTALYDGRLCEVPSLLQGSLGGITFRRAWTYYIAMGKVPIAVARTLYADPVGSTDIRAGGYSGGIDPTRVSTEIDGESYVTSYHIDSEVGLRVFADAIRGKHS